MRSKDMANLRAKENVCSPITRAIVFLEAALAFSGPAGAGAGAGACRACGRQGRHARVGEVGVQRNTEYAALLSKPYSFRTAKPAR